MAEPIYHNEARRKLEKQIADATGVPGSMIGGDPDYWLKGRATVAELEQAKKIMNSVTINTEQLTEAFGEMGAATRKATRAMTSESENEAAARMAYESYSEGVTLTKWEDLPNGMREVWRRTAKAMAGHLSDRLERRTEEERLKRPDGKRVSRNRMGGTPFDPMLPAQIWGEPVIDREEPAKFAVGLDAAQRPVRLFLDNVEISRQVSEFTVNAKLDGPTEVTLKFPARFVESINVNEMPHNPKLKMKVIN